MSKPQLENGYIRIANELWDEVLRRNFSKRQQNLILFIWRMSYGTGQKNCYIEQFNYFELAGIYRSDVKKELNYLRDCAVLDWDEKTMIFSINKDYKLWQISPNKHWDSERLDELIHINLNRKKVSKTPTAEKPRVSKTLTLIADGVSKTLTMKLVKYQLRHAKKPVVARVRRVPKDSIKDIKRFKDNTTTATTSGSESFYAAHERIFGFGINPFQADQIASFIDQDGMDESVVIRAIERAASASPGHSFRLITKILSDYLNSGAKTLDQAIALDRDFEAKRKQSSYRGPKQTKPAIPIATRTEQVEEISDEEYERMLQIAQKLERG